MEERCGNCKWYDESANGWCICRAKFVNDESPFVCERYEVSNESRQGN